MKMFFEGASRIVRDNDGYAVEVGTKKNSFLGEELGLFHFDTLGDAQNAYYLASKVLETASDFCSMLDFDMEMAIEEGELKRGDADACHKFRMKQLAQGICAVRPKPGENK